MKTARMRLLVFFISIIHFGKMDAQAFQNLPVKIEECPVEFIDINGQKIKGYLIEISDSTIRYVEEKHDIRGAIINDCSNCISLSTGIISSGKKKGGLSKTVEIAGILIAAGTIWTLSGNSESADGTSEIGRRSIGLLVGIPVAILTGMAFGKNHKSTKWVNELKDETSKFKFYRSCKETVKKFRKDGKLNKNYSFYLGKSMEKINGKLVGLSIQGVVVVEEDTNTTHEIEWKSLYCVTRKKR